VIHRYGEHPDQFCEQVGSAGPTVVLLHGGFWRARYGLDLMRPMAADLVQRGWVTWNVEYRRVGTGGGYPATLEDVAAACRAADGLGLGPLVSLGHSAGGHLSLWLAGEGLVAGVVSLGGVCCLAGAAEERLGNGAADDFMGARSDDARVAYGRADPLRRLPTGVPTTLVHGVRDDTVPIEQSRTYAAAALAAGDDCALVELPGGHFDVIDPRSAGWPTVVEGLERVRPSLNPA
jgi:acetyl esterase/lipase